MQRLRSAFLAAVAGSALAVTVAHASGESVIVEIDRAQILRIDGEPVTLILGNPAIADALVQDRHTLVVTGKSFGTTNLIALDPEGNAIADMLLHVRSPGDGVVTVQKGVTRMSYSCAPQCEPTLTVGDTAENYDLVNSQIQSRIGLAQGQAGNR